MPATLRLKTAADVVEAHRPPVARRTDWGASSRISPRDVRAAVGFPQRADEGPRLVLLPSVARRPREDPGAARRPPRFHCAPSTRTAVEGGRPHARDRAAATRVSDDIGAGNRLASRRSRRGWSGRRRAPVRAEGEPGAGQQGLRWVEAHGHTTARVSGRWRAAGTDESNEPPRRPRVASAISRSTKCGPSLTATGTVRRP